MTVAGTPVGRFRLAVEQLLKETAELREHLQQGTVLHEAAGLQRQFRRKGNVSPTAALGATRLGACGRDHAETPVREPEAAILSKP